MAEIIKKLRNFDAYPKTLDDFRIKTYGGAAGTFNKIQSQSPVTKYIFFSVCNKYNNNAVFIFDGIKGLHDAKRYRRIIRRHISESYYTN